MKEELLTLNISWASPYGCAKKPIICHKTSDDFKMECVGAWNGFVRAQ